MDADTGTTWIAQVGETAGRIWTALSEQGPMSLAKLVKVVGQPRDTVMQGVGWLAREDKVSLSDTPRGRVIALR